METWILEWDRCRCGRFASYLGMNWHTKFTATFSSDEMMSCAKHGLVRCWYRQVTPRT